MTTFDPIQYKHTTQEQWQAARASVRWEPGSFPHPSASLQPLSVSASSETPLPTSYAMRWLTDGAHVRCIREERLSRDVLRENLAAPVFSEGWRSLPYTKGKNVDRLVSVKPGPGRH